MRTVPALFISHGSPLTVITEDDYAAALRATGRGLGAPRAVVVVSAHGITPDGMVSITAAERPRLIYDFGGFPPELYRFEYACPGSPALAAELAERLGAVGLETGLDPLAGIDHGVWVPLARLFPAADVPVVQVSMPFPSPPERVLEMGRALGPLRDEGVLLVGSGGAVHNLRALDWHARSKTASPWAVAFDAWVRERVELGDVEALLRFRTEAPHAQMAHPTTDHFQPIFFTLGAMRDSDRPTTIVDEFQYQTLSMYSFAIG
jgi:4,5-DOPA dioxygenase extradiol